MSCVTCQHLSKIKIKMFDNFFRHTFRFFLADHLSSGSIFLRAGLEHVGLRTCNTLISYLTLRTKSTVGPIPNRV